VLSATDLYASCAVAFQGSHMSHLLYKPFPAAALRPCSEACAIYRPFKGLARICEISCKMRGGVRGWKSSMKA
jgi:hypothetical protein